MKNYEFWFIVGSQFLYGPEVLETVDKRAREMAEALTKVLPYPVVYKVTAKTNREITDTVKEANYRDQCAGVITWCHTFSPSKMWIDGLRDLQKLKFSEGFYNAYDKTGIVLIIVAMAVTALGSVVRDRVTA